MTDGTLLRGEVLARWQEYVGTGEFFRQVESTISRIRDRITAAVKGGPPRPTTSARPSSRVSRPSCQHSPRPPRARARAWRTLLGGAALSEHPGLAKPSPALDSTIARMVRDWQGDVLDLVRSEGRDRRTTARIAAYGLNGIGVILMLVAFAHTGGLVGAEVGIAGGTAVLAQKVLGRSSATRRCGRWRPRRASDCWPRWRTCMPASGPFDAAIEGVEVKEDEAAHGEQQQRR